MDGSTVVECVVCRELYCTVCDNTKNCICGSWCVPCSEDKENGYDPVTQTCKECRQVNAL